MGISLVRGYIWLLLIVAANSHFKQKPEKEKKSAPVDAFKAKKSAPLEVPVHSFKTKPENEKKSPPLEVPVRTLKTKKEKEKKHAPVDAFKVMASLPNLIAAYVSSPNPAYQCLHTTLAYYDGLAKEGTNVWHFKSPVDHHSVVKEVTFDITEGTTSDQVYFLLDGNRCRLYIAHYHYTDYESCVVSTISYNQEDRAVVFPPVEAFLISTNADHDAEYFNFTITVPALFCMLWVTKEVVNAIPEDCLAAYHATCHEKYAAYDREICEV